MIDLFSVDLGERYYQLSRLGRETFCASVAQATLVRTDDETPSNQGLALGTGSGIAELTRDSEGAPNALLAGSSFVTRTPLPSEILPLVKKLGTPFVDLITLGRTDGNDITITDISVSRFQAFFRRRHGRWFLCDAGSSNGTRVDGEKLKPRTEAEILSQTRIRFGAVQYVFHTADSLYDLLVNSHAPAASLRFD